MPRFHDTIPDSCNPNLTDEQIGELVREAQEDFRQGRYTELAGPDEIEVHVMNLMTGDAPPVQQAG